MTRALLLLLLLALGGCAAIADQAVYNQVVWDHWTRKDAR